MTQKILSCICGASCAVPTLGPFFLWPPWIWFGKYSIEFLPYHPSAADLFPLLVKWMGYLLNLMIRFLRVHVYTLQGLYGHLYHQIQMNWPQFLMDLSFCLTLLFRLVTLCSHLVLYLDLTSQNFCWSGYFFFAIRFCNN